MCVCVCVCEGKMLLLRLQVFCAAAMCVLCSSQRVFFQCGAKLDVVDVQGLILSPGFPGNYSSGTHCVWQFFVPVGHQLTMEMFYFDVFESSERTLSTSADLMTSEDGEEHLPTKGLSRSQSELQEPSMVTMEIREESRETVWNTSQRLSERLSHPGISDHQQENAENSTIPSSVEDDTDHPPPSSTPPTVTEDVSETPQPVKDMCPDDVLYITDLITFSSRFCGSKRPSDDRLVFGSDVEMVEVIMELITNTHWGRGFALIFRYRNQTAVEVGGQRSSAPSVGAVEALLAAVSLAALFATGLMIVLCVTLRPKLCVKESNMASSSITSEVPVQNIHTDGSELQLVSANRSEQELNKHDNLRLPHTGNAHLLPHTGNAHLLPHTGNAPDCRSFQNAELECSDGLMEMELGTDEVFVISNAATPSFSHCTHREHILRHSETGSVQPSDWMPRSEPSNWPSRRSHVGSARPRAWSVRTFHDFLLPLPQLNRKWCSWNLTSPFTKLVDTLPPGSVVGGADGVKIPSVQHQRRYNSGRSQTSQQLCEPDGALCGLEQGVEVKICKFSAAEDEANLTIPEEDDREPLVSAEPQNRVKNSEIGNHESFPSLGSTHLAFTDEDLTVLKNTSKIQLPSLSHVTVPCDSAGKDM
ncbi:uncharacterized protein si:dkey-112e17.1 isoform X4 [Hemibagrus wyckioides]|uniref:uncharacterized protein si:dkey-112e17.1 isoform X4 n=1 Tax=Hemibagrus wyckioides TaxID=337641 RepID=UPI00266BCA5C|nr:uncharacterized protein si:dkey-112e17.1 isoform X4 [Hemibagrus wyckioides]